MSAWWSFALIWSKRLHVISTTVTGAHSVTNLAIDNGATVVTCLLRSDRRAHDTGAVRHSRE